MPANEQELQLLQLYRLLSDTERSAILNTIATLLACLEHAKPITQTVRSAVKH